jgi:hypothetical protein
MYLVPDEKELHAWLCDSFFVHGNDETFHQFMGTAQLAEYSTFHLFPETGEILMLTHHWQIDMMGAIHLLNRFLEILAAAEPFPTFGDEWRRLSPGHAEAAPLPTELSKKSLEAAERIAKMNPFCGRPSIGLEVTPREPGSTRCSTLAFDSSTLKTIVNACKKANISVTSAIHAALIVATQEIAPKARTKTEFTSVAFFNHRAYLRSPYNNTRAWPMGCWMLGLPFSFPLADFVTHAKALQKIYKQDIALDQCDVQKYYDTYVRKLAEALEQRRKTPSIS